MKRVVLDTNIYISALVFGGKPQDILVWAEVGLYKLFVSTEILNELQAKLSGKFGWTANRVQRAVDKILAVGNLAFPEVQVTVCVDPDDNKILECAVEAGANYIISGDKHLLNMKTFRGIQIITPAHFFKNELWK